jgi:hypothetical protein
MKWLLVLLLLLFLRRRHLTPVVTSFSLAALIEGRYFGVSAMSLDIGKTLSLKVVNVQAAGVAVDLTLFPTALTGVSWSVDKPDLGAVNSTQADGMVADYVGKVAGDVVVTATGNNVHGVVVSKSVTVTNTVPVPVVPVVDSFDIEATPA